MTPLAAGAAIPGRGSSACPPTRRSSTGWASTTPAPPRWRATSCSRARRRCRPASWSASTSVAARQHRRPRPRPTTSRRSASSRRWPTTSRSTSARRTRRACATSRHPDRLRELLATLRAGRRAGSVQPSAARQAGSRTSSRDAFAASGRRLADDRPTALILSNTTTARDRPAHPDPARRDRRPLRRAAARSDARGRGARARGSVRDRLAIIASGGIGSGRRTRPRPIAAGADLVQLWTGPGLPRAGADRRGRSGGPD